MVFSLLRDVEGHIYHGEPVIQSLTVNEDIDLKRVICSESALREFPHHDEPHHSQTLFFWPDSLVLFLMPWPCIWSLKRQKTYKEKKLEANWMGMVACWWLKHNTY